jgi:hypothetical protein
MSNASRLAAVVKVKQNASMSTMNLGHNASMSTMNYGSCVGSTEFFEKIRGERRQGKILRKTRMVSGDFGRDYGGDVQDYNLKIGFLENLYGKQFQELDAERRKLERNCLRLGKKLKGQKGAESRAAIGPMENVRYEDIPFIKMEDAQPRLLDLYDNNLCYIWAETVNKIWPAHVVTTIRELEFSYYYNFVSRNELIGWDHSRGSLKTGIDRGSRLVDFSKMRFGGTVGPEHFEKPTLSAHDMHECGNLIDIEPTRKRGCEFKKPDFLVILIAAPKPLRAAFSISFTHPKANTDLRQIEDNLFGEEHKRKLYKIDDASIEMKYFKAPPPIQLPRDMLAKNMKMIEIFNEYKQNYRKKVNSTLKINTSNALNKARENRVTDLKKKYHFLERHEGFKERAQQELEEQCRLLKKYLTLYFWRFLMKYYLCMKETQRLYMIQKNKALIYFMANNKITLIQRAFRKRYNDPEVSRDSNKANIISGLRLRCMMFRNSTYGKAMEISGRFFTYIIQVLRMRTTFLKYSGYIENIQKRWRTHLALKNDARENLEDVWAKQVMFMVENGEEFKKDYGITFNIEN